MNDEPKKPLNLRAMARQGRVPAKWLREEAEAGRIPHLRAGSVLLFDPAAVERAIAERLRRAEEKGGIANA